MTLFLVRFAELGLKSERVRSRFLKQLADDIEGSLIDAGVEHFMEVSRGRIFIQTDQEDEASGVLSRVPGVFSFSSVEPAPAEKDQLMKALSRFGETRIGKGMTYGLRVRRTGNHPFSSQEIAVEGGGAVVSHLKEGDARVDLERPDIRVEVEIRETKAYIFDNRTKGLGGMPSSSQGKVLLLLGKVDEESRMRAELSYTLMRRRGCKVIPAAVDEDDSLWEGLMERTCIYSGKGPFILRGPDLMSSLLDAVAKLKANGVVIPSGPGGEQGFPVIHSNGAAVAQFYPTASMDIDEVRSWLERLGQ